MKWYKDKDGELRPIYEECDYGHYYDDKNPLEIFVTEFELTLKAALKVGFWMAVACGLILLVGGILQLIVKILGIG